MQDIAILTHRFIPVGAEFAETGASIPKRLLFAGGPGQFFRFAGFVLGQRGALSPYFDLHAHLLMLELNPGMPGWASFSWFLDPALEAVSPHLAHLRRVPVENGARLFFFAHDREGRSGALATSRTRKRLFDEGRYSPAIYSRVWPRKAMITWARKQGATASQAERLPSG